MTLRHGWLLLNLAPIPLRQNWGARPSPLPLSQPPGGWDRFVDVTLPGITLCGRQLPPDADNELQSVQSELSGVDTERNDHSTRAVTPASLPLMPPAISYLKTGSKPPLPWSVQAGVMARFRWTWGAPMVRSNAPGDYTNVSQTVTFAPGEVLKTITIPVVDDTLVEGDETVRPQPQQCHGRGDPRSDQCRDSDHYR